MLLLWQLQAGSSLCFCGPVDDAVFPRYGFCLLECWGLAGGLAGCWVGGPIGGLIGRDGLRVALTWRSLEDS